MFRNPVVTDEAGGDHGDPFVLRHLDSYFLYHTTDDGDRGISVLRSTDLVNWTREGFALEPGGPGHWAETDLWAPEVMYLAGCFYMYVSGTRMGEDGEGIEDLRRQGLARSRTPLGPFVLDDEPLVSDTWSIDGHPFVDEDGSTWLYYNIRTEATMFENLPGSGTVTDRLVTPDRLAGDPRPVAFPSERWEGNFADDGYWNEGSWVLKRRGRYYQLYSGGWYREASYGIGVTAAERPEGPWRKEAGNPIFRSGDRITGPGHHSMVLAPDGVTLYSVYHGYDNGLPGRKVHLDPVRFAGDRPIIGGPPFNGRPTEDEQPLPPQPVHDPNVATWHADAWICGPSVRIDGFSIDLPTQEEPWRVRANQSATGLRVWVDGRLERQRQGWHRPQVSAGGKMLSLSLTSHLEDETVRWLPPGESHSWRWGGELPAELTLAVKGCCTVSLGSARVDVEERGDRFALVHLVAPEGGMQVVAEGREHGAHVTDLVVTARAEVAAAAGVS
jgi:GH43 family beta-xylosidase